MQKLLAFIVAKRHWFLFVFCEIIAFVLIYHNNAYQRNMILSSANAITGRLLSVSSAVFSYFDLQKANQELFERNSLLEMEVLLLREQLNNLSSDKTQFGQVFLKDTVLADSLIKRNNAYQFVSARVVNNSVNSLTNYFTINKGSNDGIHSDMGVISPHGIAGVITTVGDGFAVAMSLLHVKSGVSCKIQHTSFFGPLSWKGGDVRYGYLEKIATHANFLVGDTIVTSGYSDLFPPGIMVGIIESYKRQEDDNFYSLKVRFATDFQSLNAINVIDNLLQNEQKDIEREAKKND